MQSPASPEPRNQTKVRLRTATAKILHDRAVEQLDIMEDRKILHEELFRMRLAEYTVLMSKFLSLVTLIFVVMTIGFAYLGIINWT
jgi:hypothetical protein